MWAASDQGDVHSAAQCTSTAERGKSVHRAVTATLGPMQRLTCAGFAAHCKPINHFGDESGDGAQAAAEAEREGAQPCERPVGEQVYVGAGVADGVDGSDARASEHVRAESADREVFIPRIEF